MDTLDGINEIRRLRRVERAVEPPARDEIVATREFLERLVGPTVRPALAARLFGVTQPSLYRWLNSNDIETVMTPEGRREIPLSEVLALLEQTEELGTVGRRYPLAAVVKARRGAAEGAIDVDRLLRRRKGRSHRAPELQALAYHRLVAERLDAELAAEARRRLARWRTAGQIHPRWADEWERILALPLPQIAKAISADTQRARELRQTSPFSGALTPQERRVLVKAVEERVSG